MYIRFLAIENKMMRKRKIRESIRIIVLLCLTAATGNAVLLLMPVSMFTKIFFFVFNFFFCVLLINKQIKEIIKHVILGTKEEYEDRLDRQLYMVGEKK